jgi:hypothetical protein
MKPMRIVTVVLLVAVSACSWRPDPDRYARKFFDEGQEMIIKALKKQDASDQQLAAAEAVLAKYEPTLPGEIAVVMRKQRDLFRGVATGRDSATLVRLEADLHQAHEQTARVIGRMHEEIGTAVGDTAWKGAQAQLDKRWEKHFDE